MSIRLACSSAADEGGDPLNAIASAAWMIHTNYDNVIPHFTFQVGPKAYMGLLANEDRGVLAMAIGGAVRWELIPRQRLAFFGSAFYTPSVLIFGAANDVYDLTAGAQIPMP